MDPPFITDNRDNELFFFLPMEKGRLKIEAVIRCLRVGHVHWALEPAVGSFQMLGMQFGSVNGEPSGERREG